MSHCALGVRSMSAAVSLSIVATSCLASAQTPDGGLLPPLPVEEDFDYLSGAGFSRGATKVGRRSDDESRRRGFDPRVHVAMARGSIAATCSNLLGRAQWNQDVSHFFAPEAHFDNCAFDESVAYLGRLVAEARRYAAADDYKSTLTALGQALHGIQDFYSHSDYVERSVAKYRYVSAVPVIPIWETRGAAELGAHVKGGLVSGVVWWEPTLRRCVEPAKSHSELAKDGPSTQAGSASIAPWHRTGHEAALALADRATVEFLRWAWESMPLLEDRCGPVIGYALLVDRRAR